MGCTDKNLSKEYGVTLTSANEIELSGEAKVKEKEDYTFTAKLKSGIEGKIKIGVSVNGAAVTPEDIGNGSYKLSAVNGEVLITASFEAFLEFTVTGPGETANVNFEGEIKAKEGKDYIFEIAPKKGYDGKDIAVSATVGGKTVKVVKNEDGTYKIPTVDGNVAITVSGIVLKAFTVVKPTAEGIEFEGKDTVLYGGNYTFSINIKESYQKSADFKILVDGDEIEPAADGKYVVTNCLNGFTITAEGVETKQFTATYTVEGDYNDVIDKTAEKFLYTSENYTVAFELGEKYNQCKNSVKVFYKTADSEETEIIENSEGAYVIVNPKKDVTIILKGVIKNIYDVNFIYDGNLIYTLKGVEVDSSLTEEQLNAAKTEFEKDGVYKFIGWENVPETVTGKTVISPKSVGASVVDNIVYNGPAEDMGGNPQFTLSSESAPEGYDHVYEKKSGFNISTAYPFGYLHGRLSHADITAYCEVSFAFKCNQNFVMDTDTTTPESGNGSHYDGWLMFRLTKNVNGIWHIHVTNNGTTLRDFDDNEVRNNVCSILWHGRTGGFTPAGIGEGLEVYCTELRGVTDTSIFVGETVTKSFIGGTESSTESVPGGFKNVSHIVADYNETNKSTGAAYTVWADTVDKDVSAYNYLVFKIKVTGSWILFDGWSHYFASDEKWTTVEMVRNTESSWDIKFAGAVGTVTVREGNNLNILLKMEFDCRCVPAGFTDCVPSELWITELRGVTGGIAKTEGKVIEDSVYHAKEGDASIAIGLSKTFAPAGFVSVYKFVHGSTANESFLHGMFLSQKSLSDYKKVLFALKTNGCIQLNSNSNRVYNDEWYFFTLTLNDDKTWNLEIKCNGIIIDSAKNLTGDNLRAILWSNIDPGYCPINLIEGVRLRVYMTEIRGVLKA